MLCLETKNLTHHFSSGEPVLRAISLQVAEGSIYGFLGPNGAGKTTTLRLVLGLLARQQGEIGIFGKPFHSHRVDILRKVGSLIESPSFYAQLTAKENLAVMQRLYRCPEANIPRALQLVGLGNTGKKKAGRFSLGMKQRLGIAMALLNDPSLLILDEPTNGLDPAGMVEMRELLKTLNREHGVTILVSSHLLVEVEKLATHVGIISKGALVFQGTLQELMDRRSSLVAFDTDDPAKALRIAEQQQLPACLENGRLIISPAPKETVVALNRRLVQENVGVYEISGMKNDLETIFMNLTSE